MLNGRSLLKMYFAPPCDRHPHRGLDPWAHRQLLLLPPTDVGWLYWRGGPVRAGGLEGCDGAGLRAMGSLLGPRI